MAIVPLGPARISNNYLRLIHRIDLKIIDETIQNLNNEAQDKMNSKSLMSSLIKVKIDKLNLTFRKLQPYSRVKRWEKLGEIWKYVSGSPDAEDLRIINKTSNSLVDQNNKQITINHIFENRLNNISNDILGMLKDYNSLASETFTGFDSVNLLFNIDELIKQLEYIEEAIDLARQNIPSSRIISSLEMEAAQQFFKHNGLEATIAENILDIASAYIIYSKDIIIYILKVPRIKNAEYSLNFVESVISTNRTRIHLASNYYLSGPKFHTIKEPCSKYRNIYICPSSLLEPMAECIQQIIKGETAQCPTERVYSNNSIRRIDDGNILINDADVILASNCSNQRRELKGAFLIQFSSCMLNLNGEEYSNNNLEIPAKSFIPTTGVKVNSTIIINRIPLEYLQELHTEQRHHIHHLNLTTENLHWNIHLFGWLSFGGISTISIFLAIIIILWITKSLIPQKSTLVISKETPVKNETNPGDASTTNSSPNNPRVASMTSRLPIIPFIPQE